MKRLPILFCVFSIFAARGQGGGYSAREYGEGREVHTLTTEREVRALAQEEREACVLTMERVVRMVQERSIAGMANAGRFEIKF